MSSKTYLASFVNDGKAEWITPPIGHDVPALSVGCLGRGVEVNYRTRMGAGRAVPGVTRIKTAARELDVPKATGQCSRRNRQDAGENQTGNLRCFHLCNKNSHS